VTRVLRRTGATSRRRAGEAGVASLELIGMVPLALITAFVVLQVAVLLWAVTATDDAVRQGVRAVSLGNDGCAVARDVLSDTLDERCRVTGGRLGQGSSVELVVGVPLLPPVDDLFPDVRITREAFLP